MKRIIVLLIGVFLVLSTQYKIEAEDHDNVLSNMEIMADDALQLAKVNRFNESKMVLENMQELMNYTPFLTGDEIRILKVSFHEALGVLKKEDIPYEEAVSELTKFRLVVDAIATEYNPLWAEMQNSVFTAFHSLKTTIEKKDQMNFYHELNGLLSIYNMIYPSIVLDVSIDKVEKVNAQLQYIEQNGTKILNSDEGIQTIDALKTDLENLFNDTEEDEADPSLWWVIISTGGLIVITLTYVGWRKYKAEKENKKAKGRVQKD